MPKSVSKRGRQMALLCVRVSPNDSVRVCGYPAAVAFNNTPRQMPNNLFIICAADQSWLDPTQTHSQTYGRRYIYPESWV